MKLRPEFVLLSLAVSLAAVACGGPDSPSSPASSAASPANTANGSDGAGSTGAAASTVTGTIRAFGGSCPALTFTLEGKTIKTDATTSFADVTCASLKNEVRVTVVGTTQADGSVRATTVRPAPALPVPAVPTVPPAPSPTTLTITGTIHSFSGSCASVTFTLEGKTIKTNGTTSFGDIACTALKNDVRVTVVGTSQADGSVLATTVRPAPALPVPAPPAPVPPTATSVTITGTIHGLVAGCPMLTFTLEGKTIKTSAATSFGSGTCAALANDMRVTVVGTTQGDGSVLATEVRR